MEAEEVYGLINGKVGKLNSDLQDIVNSGVDTTARASIGTLSTLTTTDKTDLVKAINEVNAKPTGGNTDVINVKDYGAIGDGTTNDTVAIKQCVDIVNLSGGILYFPNGIYKITDTLLFTKHGLRIIGSGISGTYIKMSNKDVPAIKFYNASVTMSGCKVENLSLFTDTALVSASNGIEMINQVNSAIENVTIVDFKTGLKLRGVGNSLIKAVGMSTGVSEAIGIDTSDKSVSTYYLNCYVGFVGSAAENGIGLLSSTNNIADMNVEYFDVANGAYGVYINGSQSPTEFPPADINLKNIVCDGQRVAGIHVVNIGEQGCVNISCGWLNPLAGLTPKSRCVNLSNVNNVTLSNVTMQQLANSTPSIYGIAMYIAKNVKVNDCTFINVYSAVNCTDVDHLVVDGNVASLYSGKSSEAYAFIFELVDGLICTSNSITGTFSIGISLYAGGSRSIVTNNIITGSTTQISNGQTGAVVTNNLV